MISMLMDRRRLFVLNWIYSKQERRFCKDRPCHSKKASERERERDPSGVHHTALLVIHHVSGKKKSFSRVFSLCSSSISSESSGATASYSFY